MAIGSALSPLAGPGNRRSPRRRRRRLLWGSATVLALALLGLLAAVRA